MPSLLASGEGGQFARRGSRRACDFARLLSVFPTCRYAPFVRNQSAVPGSSSRVYYMYYRCINSYLFIILVIMNIIIFVICIITVLCFVRNQSAAPRQLEQPPRLLGVARPATGAA